MKGWLWLMIGLLVVGCGRAEDSWQRVQENGVLHVGLDPTYPPFAVATADDLFGFDVDLARALADELGLQVQFAYFGYDGLYDALGARQADVLISALIIDPTRTRDFAYSDPYFNAGQMLLVPAGSPINGPADLRQTTLAVELGSEGHVQGLAWGRQIVGLMVLPLNSPEQVIEAVGQKEADAALLDHINARLHLAQTDYDLHLAPTPITVEPYALVVQAQDKQLLAHLNIALHTLTTNGTLDRLSTHWLDGP